MRPLKYEPTPKPRTRGIRTAPMSDMQLRVKRRGQAQRDHRAYLDDIESSTDPINLLDFLPNLQHALDCIHQSSPLLLPPFQVLRVQIIEDRSVFFNRAVLVTTNDS